MSNENKIAHLSFIQGVINRMGNNSFIIKGWAVTLLTVLFALLSGKDNKISLFIPIAPLFLFWWLDAYFLHQERLYRKLYDKVAQEIEPCEHFGMNAYKYRDEVATLWRVAVSKTLLSFYAVLLIVYIALAIILF